MDSLRKSFKQSPSPPRSNNHSHERQPMLYEHNNGAGPNDSSGHREFFVNIDRTNSAGFSFPSPGKSGKPPPPPQQQQQQQRRQRPAAAELNDDPPSQLISSFLNKQRAAGTEVALDMDLEMEELRNKPTSTSDRISKDVRVSFQKSAAESPPSSSDEDHRSSRRRPLDHDVGEVLHCTSNSTFQRKSGMLRTKTRSRLIDPAPHRPITGGSARRSPAVSGQQPPRSGFLGATPPPPHDEDDEDPFIDDDIPEELKRSRINSLTIIQWISLLLIVAALTCSLSIPRLQSQRVWNLHLWKWELMLLVLICGRLVSGWIIRVAVFFIERNFLLRKRVLYFVYGVRKAVQNCLWLGLVLLSWHYIFDDKVERETKSRTLRYVTKVFFCLLVGAIFFLIKTLLVKILASSFHVSTYFDRIQEALFKQYLIETLSGPPLVDEENVSVEAQNLQTPKMNNKSKEFSRQLQSPKADRKGIYFITIDFLHMLNQKNISAWNMKRLMRIVRYGSLTTIDEQIADAEYESSAMEIRSEYEAKVAARRIFNNVAKPGSKYIYFCDLKRFLREDELAKAVSLFEGAEEKQRVSRRALKNWVVNAFRERKALALTLNDTKTAINKLHQMVNVVIGIIVLGLWLLILGIATIQFFVLISSQLLLAVFIFGNTLKTTFEAIIFLFVMHPFDVGDRCEIGGVQMVVEEMNILTTVFLRYDNQKMIYPNSVLATTPIGNIYRSPDMGDAIDFCIHVSTPIEKITIMKERIKAFMENKMEHWQPAPTVVLRDVDDMNRLKISVWMCHRMNFQDMGERWARRELVLQEMIKVLRELDIEFRMLPMDVNVRNMPPLTSTRVPSNWTTCS